VFIVARTLVANRRLAGSACGKRRRARPLNSVVSLHLMATCPHCRENTIGAFAKWYAWSGRPAQCTKCGGLSRASNVHGTWAGRAFGVAVVVSPLIVIFTGMWWPAVGLVAVLALVELVAFARMPMVAVTAEEAPYARRSAFLFGALLLFVATAAVAWSVYRANAA
jgi:hypothetical protein